MDFKKTHAQLFPLGSQTDAVAVVEFLERACDPFRYHGATPLKLRDLAVLELLKDYYSDPSFNLQPYSQDLFRGILHMLGMSAADHFEAYHVVYPAEANMRLQTVQILHGFLLYAGLNESAAAKLMAWENCPLPEDQQPWRLREPGDPPVPETAEEDYVIEDPWLPYYIAHYNRTGLDYYDSGNVAADWPDPIPEIVMAERFRDRRARGLPEESRQQAWDAIWAEWESGLRTVWRR